MSRKVRYCRNLEEYYEAKHDEAMRSEEMMPKVGIVVCFVAAVACAWGAINNFNQASLGISDDIPDSHLRNYTTQCAAEEIGNSALEGSLQNIQSPVALDSNRFEACIRGKHQESEATKQNSNRGLGFVLALAAGVTLLGGVLGVKSRQTRVRLKAEPS